MHELAITQSILNIATSEAKNNNAKKVLSITIKLGEYSGVVPALVQEYFNLISSNTVAENAKLILEKVPLSVKCNECEAVSHISKLHIECPICKSINLKMLTGREFYVSSLEVE